MLAGDLLLELRRRLPDEPADRDGQPGLGDAALALRVPVHSGRAGAQGSVSAAAPHGKHVAAGTSELASFRHSVAEQVNFYQHLQLQNATDGRIHLPPTFSPEYAVAPDCNYDNALYRYALSALVDAIDTLGLSDPLAAQYRLSLEKLSPSPVAP